MAKTTCLLDDPIKEAILTILDELKEEYDSVEVDGKEIPIVDLITIISSCTPPEKTLSKKKRKRKPSAYNIFMSHCLKGEGEFEGQGRKAWGECIAIWRERKKKKG